MEPLFQHLVIGAVPQPGEMPPKPFGRDELQAAFVEVSKQYPYQQLVLFPDGSGAQFMNGPEDATVVRPELVQIQMPIEGTPERARMSCESVFAAVAGALELEVLLQVGIKVIARIPLDGSARDFVSNQLTRTPGPVSALGDTFFAGGVKFRSLDEVSGQEVNLLVEPDINDDTYLFLDYDAQRMGPAGFSDLGGWMDDAFEFIREPAMHILDSEG